MHLNYIRVTRYDSSTYISIITINKGHPHILTFVPTFLTLFSFNSSSWLFFLNEVNVSVRIYLRIECFTFLNTKWFFRINISCGFQKRSFIALFAWCTLRNLPFVTWHPTFFLCAQMFHAQQDSTKGSSRSSRPRLMSSDHQALQSTCQYVKDKIMVKFPKFLWFFQP